MFRFIAVLAILFATSASLPAQDYKGEPGETVSEAARAIVSANRISPEMQRFFQQAGKVPVATLDPVSKDLAAAGFGPIGYCCHNDGSCDCVGLLDCATMFTSSTCNTDQPIICDDQGCSCTEAGPTICPFDNCCSD